ncbi:MAG: NYN domain-containing protein [Spirochaetia bacterium]|jgi:uncharacterized LabA/DUF88 family protein
MDELVILIDGGYLDETLKGEFNRVKIDYRKLPQKIESMIPSSKVLRTYYFHCLPYMDKPPTQEQSERYSKRQQFYATLGNFPRFEVVTGILAKRYDENGQIYFEQKRVDMLLGLKAVHFSAKGKIGHIALLAGDSDYVPAIKLAKEDGVDVFLFHGQSYHHELWQNSDVRIKIDKAFIDSILF